MILLFIALTALGNPFTLSKHITMGITASDADTCPKEPEELL
ncbi:MAG: hypothetical protein EZS28_001648, partial [Streblomastix strix]